MQYIDKDGKRHDIPLHSVQPKISPDTDNALYESGNGLKVDKFKTVVSPDTDNILYESPNGLKVDEIKEGATKVYGYLNPDDGEFYKDKTHKRKIDPNTSDTYVDITKDAIWKPYVWDEDNYLYRGIGSGQGMGSATLVSMTQAQYDILPDSEKQDGSFAYFIENPDDGSEALVADMLSDKLADAISRKMLDALYPIGSIAYGTKPAIGTWTKVGETKILNNSDDQLIVIETGKYTIGEIAPGTSKYYTIAPAKTGYDCIGIIPSFGGGTYYSQCSPLINFGGSATAKTCTVSYWNNSGTLTAKDMFVGWQAIFRSKYGTETVTKWKRTA